jgi:hypothetical protein
MAITKTDNYDFPLLDDSGKNWGAVFNGVLLDLDQYIARALDPLTDDVDVLVLDGDVLFWDP